MIREDLEHAMREESTRFDATKRSSRAGYFIAAGLGALAVGGVWFFLSDTAPVAPAQLDANGNPIPPAPSASPSLVTAATEKVAETAAGSAASSILVDVAEGALALV